MSLCSASERIAAMRACILASRVFALQRFADPWTLRDRLWESLRRRSRSALWGLGPGMISPVESVASADTPRSTPSTPAVPWFSAWGRCELSGVSTAILTHPRSATRETVADRILPVQRNDSRIRTQPRLGMRRREPATRNWSQVSVKRSWMPFLRNFGYLARPAKKFGNACPSGMIALCGAFWVTSRIHGNCARFMAFNCRRSAACEGLGRLLSAFQAAYCRCHSAKA